MAWKSKRTQLYDDRENYTDPEGPLKKEPPLANLARVYF